jgi:5-methylcytosine-specific restriction endonuclease McrA
MVTDSLRSATHHQRLVLYARSEGKCEYCGVDIKFDNFQADHIVPWSQGGRTTLSNLATSCYMCNGAKHIMNSQNFKTLINEKGLDWRRRRYFAIKATFSNV